MAKQSSADLVQGTLDMLVLQSLKNDVLHGFAIARHIQQASAEHLQIEEGSLYPALHRMERRGLIESQWGQSESNRRAKFYRITGAGRKHLKSEVVRWNRMVEAISDVLSYANRRALT